MNQAVIAEEDRMLALEDPACLVAPQLLQQAHDVDPDETEEWLTALATVFQEAGADRAAFLLQTLQTQASAFGLTGAAAVLSTAYVNSINPADEALCPDDEAVVARLQVLLRWNAIAMVIRAGKRAPELGGHIASYAAIALLYETGFNHFFRARSAQHLGDFVLFQGHSSPGIYARAFLEGRLTVDQLDNFRQEVGGQGLSSYPHPWLMPTFWQFPTVSMGLGVLQALYQARFMRYLEHRGLIPAQDRKVWCFCGDGEMDEPESLGALRVAAREKLDNLIIVVSCNLQRLDGPVFGNGKIIQELASIFAGSGWRVIKVIWGRAWDKLLANDHQGVLQQRMQAVVDGDYQAYVARGVDYFREHFFGVSPELQAIAATLSDDELRALLYNRGGHDPQKVFAAYHAASQAKGQPVVVLAKTIKGFGMGDAGESANNAHQQKKMSTDHLAAFCQRFGLDLSEKEIADVAYYKPADDAPEMQYLQRQRTALGGYLPARHAADEALKAPALSDFKVVLSGSEGREISTTMAFVRVLGILLRDPELKTRIVPIVPDESRTFGMEGLFRQIGIYSPLGQTYEPVDRSQVMYYREAHDGQLLEEGINEAGAFASWMAAATAYSLHGKTMVPFYIYYSMFGFQRVGDLAWAAGDIRARGFLLGATSGRTTLAGEGLQHADGHSHIMSGLIPNCVSYDPTYAYELAVIIQDGLRRMLDENEDVFYYLTVMNENYEQPAMPDGAAAGIVRGMYCLQAAQGKKKTAPHVHLLGSGTILREVQQAAALLTEQYQVAVTIWSVTSFSELKRQADRVTRQNRLTPAAPNVDPYVTQCLAKRPGPVIAATDYVKLFADQIRAWVPDDYVVLGTDGFGCSDTRTALRQHFEVDARSIAFAALSALAAQDQLSKKALQTAFADLGIVGDKPDAAFPAGQ